MATYVGIRSDLDITKPLTIYDADVVYNDLMNIFQTLPYSDGRRAGQRVRMPMYGSFMKLYLFGAETSQLKQNIINEVYRVISYDPRIEANGVTVTFNENTVNVQIDATLVDINVNRLLNFEFIRG